MDPTVFVALATEMTKLVTVIVESQPPEVQRQMWEWYVKDLGWWRKFLHIDT